MYITNTDFYQLAMVYSHWRSGRHKVLATAEAYFRRVPTDLSANDIIMSGAYRIAELVHTSSFLDSVSLITKDLLESFIPHGHVDDFHAWLHNDFVQSFKRVSIVCAPDGERIYYDHPVVQVCGPICWVHLLETQILSILNSSVRTASLAHKIRRVTPSRISLFEFGTRRIHEAQAVHVAVDSIVGGFDATSNLEAGRVYGTPVRGTMAHSYVMSYGLGGELSAFKDFLRSYPETNSLLIDTYDVRKGILNAIRASFETHIPLNAVRLDSGEIKSLVPFIRTTLDGMGFSGTKIVVSGDFCEEKISSLGQFIPIDGIGIGSRISDPGFSMGFVYKLVASEGKPVIKMAGNKTSLPGAKIWTKLGSCSYLYDTTADTATLSERTVGESVLVDSARIFFPRLKMEDVRSRISAPPCVSFSRSSVSECYHNTLEAHKNVMPIQVPWMVKEGS